MTPAQPGPEPSAWYSPANRVPRKDQVVRAKTVTGASSRARFVVEHTREWPSGAWWELANGHATLPFGHVLAWSPDPDAAEPVSHGRGEPDARTPDEPETDDEPAIVREVTDETARAAALLRLMPPTHLDWSPHPDLPTLRTLARRLIRIVARIRWIVELEVVELSFEPDLPALDTLPEIVATFEAATASAAEMTLALTGAALRAPWTLERDGVPVAEYRRGDALRTYGLRPLVHHQAEIALLLTAMERPAPHPYPEWRFSDDAPAPQPWAAPGGA